MRVPISSTKHRRLLSRRDEDGLAIPEDERMVYGTARQVVEPTSNLSERQTPNPWSKDVTSGCLSVGYLGGVGLGTIRQRSMVGVLDLNMKHYHQPPFQNKRSKNEGRCVASLPRQREPGNLSECL